MRVHRHLTATSPGLHRADRNYPWHEPRFPSCRRRTPAAAANAATAPGKPLAPAAGAPVDPAAGAAQDPQATADIQAADQSLSQIETDLSNVDQAAASGENDVPSN